MMIGGPEAKRPNSNNRMAAASTPQFYLPAGITVDPTGNRMSFLAAGNRRVVIVVPHRKVYRPFGTT